LVATFRCADSFAGRLSLARIESAVPVQLKGLQIWFEWATK
jgi:hypothetical protein